MIYLTLNDAQLMDDILKELICGENDKDLATRLCISSQKLVDLCGQINQIMPVTIILDFDSEDLEILAIPTESRKILKSFLLSGGFKMMSESLQSQNCLHRTDSMVECDTSAVSRQEMVIENIKISRVAIVIGILVLVVIIFSLVRFIR